MANIMITKRCNLKCPYCFANEFVNKENEDMGMEDFMGAIDFIMSNPEERVGIIGGEPSIHPQFKEMLELLIADPRIKQVTIFTNGVEIDQYVEQLVHPKFTLLINCNHPKDMGESAFEKLKKNIALFANQYYMRDRITLGMNMFQPDFEYTYMFELLMEFKFQYLRTSISVPNTQELKNIDSIAYFNSMKLSVMSFFRKLLEHKIMPFYDCNMLPTCILSTEEKDRLYYLIQETGLEDKNLLCDVTTCEPVIDILPNLQAIRCFALSEATKVDIRSFRELFELKAYFNNMIDCFGYNVSTSMDCKECQQRKVMKCTGGCYAFKLNKMLAAQNFVNQID